MARKEITVSVDQVVNDFILTMGSDDYANNVSDVVIRNFALRGVREMGFDLMPSMKTAELSVNKTLGTVNFPKDFIALTRMAALGADGILYSFTKNENINLLPNRPAETIPDYKFSFESHVYRNYINQTVNGRLYGLGGGQGNGEYRLNFEEGRIELSINVGVEKVLIEYIADEALEDNPSVHKFAEEALRSYMYYKIIERKSNVPMAEKNRARQEYYNERRKANARLKSFGKEDALAVIRKNYRLSPKY